MHPESSKTGEMPKFACLRSKKINKAKLGKFRVKRKNGSSIFGEGESGGWGLGWLVGAIDGFQDIVTISGKTNDIYFVRFPHGELVSNSEALKMMDGLNNVTPKGDN